VLGPHLAAAAQELPLAPGDVAYFGGSFPRLVSRLVEQGVLRQRASGWFWTRPERAVDAIDLRSAAGGSVEIVEESTGRVLGHVDPSSAEATVHPGAVYLHQGESYLVDSLDLDCGEALVRAARPGYFTQPRLAAGVTVVAERRSRLLGRGALSLGSVHVTSQVTGFLRRDDVTGRVWDETSLDCDEHTLLTDAVWWTLDPRAVGLELTSAELAGGAHAAEHTAIGLLPLFAPCDRWDVGGLSSAAHPDTGLLTVFVHDGQAGGGGFAERGYAVAQEWCLATLERLQGCGCERGCPACCVSPRCGNASAPLDKTSAIALLRLLCA
jgi:DEAD/DEAH box helicase domain-containing protein